MKKLLLLALTPLILSGCTGLVISAVENVGVAGAQERSLGNAVDDATINASIHHQFLQNDVNDLLLNAGVTVWEGRVLLVGKVNTHEASVRAVEYAWQSDGVREVINELVVDPDSGVWDKAKDEWVEKQIEARMLITKDVSSINFTNEVVGGVAYIIGTAEDEAELRRALAVVRTTKGVKRVVSHIITKDDPRRAPHHRPVPEDTTPHQSANPRIEDGEI